ncbi:dynamin family protein [Rhodococcus ruber]|uniref:Dynamin family protein n=1 Tax=Rhodococcus ruber TaxID=1830 RepID=A0ABT4MJN6_9NOCA|nr:dynamin family protein [Rhodococcus ruber]MCZ4521189.1 dynamin family protein [Rhodococcus ruber]
MPDTDAPPSHAGSAADAATKKTLAGATKILRMYGYDATAALAEEKASTVDHRQSVVVVGEVKRGKSSLVNALVGAWVSPVGVELTTSASLVFVPSTSSRPAGTAELVFPGGTQHVGSTELPDWVTVTGARVRDPATVSLPTRAIVPLVDSSMGEIVVVDTPGSGGLDSVAAQLSAQSAQQASVLVVVSDASSTLTAPEMDFVRDVASTVDAVIVVVSKTDKNLRRWKVVVDENRRLLQQHLRRSVPVIGVSSVRALVAREQPDDADRVRAERASGIVELREMIAARLGDGTERGTRDGLRTALEGLRRVHAKIKTDISITEAGSNALPELTAQRDRLQELKDTSVQWEQWLGRDLTLARQRALAHLDTELDRVRTKWTTRINKSGMEVLRKNPQVFTAEIESDLLAAMTGTVRLFLDELRRVAEPLFESPQIWQQIEANIAASMSGESLSTGEVASKRQGLLDPSILSMGMIGTSMLGALIGVGAVAGVVWIGVNLGYKAMRTGKQNLLNWLRETTGTAKASTARMLEAALALGRPEIVVRYRDHIRTSIDTVQQQMADAKDAARLDAAGRDATLKRLSNNLRVVTATIAEIDNALTRSVARTHEAGNATATTESVESETAS